MKRRITPKRFAWFLSALLLLMAGVPACLTWREVLQTRRNTDLIAAIQQNDTLTVLALLKQGANANARELPPDTRSFWQQLWDGVRGKSPAFDAAEASTALHLAMQDGNPQIVKSLLDGGAVVDARDKEGNTPLLALVSRLSCHTDHTEDVGRLVCLTPTQFADCTQCARLLVEKGADINARDGYSMTVLMLALRNDYDGIVHLILNRGADVNSEDVVGATALMYAAQSRSVDCLRALLDRGGRIDAQDSNGHTALHYAAGNGATSCIALLLDRGADIDAQCSDGKTALVDAVSYANDDDNPASVRLLVLRGADTAITDSDGVTPLCFAEYWGKTEKAKILKQAGATAALLQAIKWRGNKSAYVGLVPPEDTKRIAALLRHGANVNARGFGHRTLLMLAALQRKHKTVRLLLQYGANVNATDEDGNTALMLITWICHAPGAQVSYGGQIEESGYLPIIRTLLKHHARVNVRNERGYTALVFAKDARSRQTVRLLKAAGAKE